MIYWTQNYLPVIPELFEFGERHFKADIRNHKYVRPLIFSGESHFLCLNIKRILIFL